MLSIHNLTKGIIFLFILTVFTSFKQDVSIIRAKVVDALGVEQTKFLEQNNPDLLKYYFYFIENSFYIDELPPDKFDTGSGVQEIEFELTTDGKIDFEKLNVLKMKLERSFESRTIYRAKGSNFIVVFYSEKEFSEMFSMDKGNIKLN